MNQSNNYTVETVVRYKLCFVQKKNFLVREKNLYCINKLAARKKKGRLLCTPLSSRTHPGAHSLQWEPCRQKHSVFGSPLRSYELLSIPNKGRPLLDILCCILVPLILSPDKIVITIYLNIYSLSQKQMGKYRKPLVAFEFYKHRVGSYRRAWLTVMDILNYFSLIPTPTL